MKNFKKNWLELTFWVIMIYSIVEGIMLLGCSRTILPRGIQVVITLVGSIIAMVLVEKRRRK